MSKVFPILVLIIFVVGCSSTPPVPSLTLPAPLRAPVKIDAAPSVSKISPTNSQNVPHTQFQTGPEVSTESIPFSARLDKMDALPRFTRTSPVSVNVDGLPLPAFINEVFGNLLGFSFEIDNQIQKKRELVTLRVTDPQSPKQLYLSARQTLTNYRVEIQRQGELLRFVPAQKQTGNLPSMIVQGLTLPEVPPSHRPIFQFIPLKVVQFAHIQRWLQHIYRGQKLEIQTDNFLNAIVLIGPPQLVSQAAKVVHILDQPTMRGKYSLRIDPAFLPASQLAQNLIKVLAVQGYSASQTPSLGNIIVLPIQQTNSVMIFTQNAEILAYIQKWAKQLDQINLNKQAGETEKPRLFFYPVKNTQAQSIVTVLNGLSPYIRKGGATFLVDPPRNALLFTGITEEWARLLPIIQKMDQPAKQILIEATIAEVTLSDQDEHGIEWVMANAHLGGLDGQLGTSGSLGVGASGLTYTLSSAAQVRAILNVFTSNSRATILSTPRLLVRSGSSASINVGSEIPTLTSQTSSNLQQGGNSAVLQQIQYRRTGVSLNIKPTVYAGRRVDLNISQQISEARPNATSNINSPEISNRQISTELTLRDGHSVLLGGMISNSHSEGQSGVPILRDIPILGQLFRVDKASNSRTELVIMIIPYIIDDDEEAKAITEAFQQRLELMPAIKTPPPESIEKSE
jgi:general secretion pathway protein D